MFCVQKCQKSHEVYIYYNEYVNEEEDESIYALKQILACNDVRDYMGTIDLVTMKTLKDTEVSKLRELYDILIDSNIKKLIVFSDNIKVLKNIKTQMPDISTVLFKIN